MERKETQREIEELETPLFDVKMKMAQKAAMANRWKDFKKIIKVENIDLLKWFDLFGNTAIHVATRSNKPQLLIELLEMLSEDNRWRALRAENREGNTVLHEVVFCKKVEMADVVFEFEKKLQPPPEEEVSEEKKGPLLEFPNHKGETPLFRAAKYGKLKMLKHMAKHKVGHIGSHLHRGGDNLSALHASVIGQYFDVALWLARMDKGLVIEKDQNGFTCLQLLSKMPHVFRSHTSMGLIKTLIYHLLPEKGYEIGDGESLEIFGHVRDVESGGNIDDRNLPNSVVSKIYYAFWKRCAKGGNCNLPR